jgi:hypothetical protein
MENILGRFPFQYLRKLRCSLFRETRRKHSVFLTHLWRDLRDRAFGMTFLFTFLAAFCIQIASKHPSNFTCRALTTGRIHTPLVYVPITRPSPPSLLRQLAYRERTPLSGPDVDPEGWKTSSVTIRGKIFNDHLVEVQCMVSSSSSTLSATSDLICGLVLSRKARQQSIFDSRYIILMSLLVVLHQKQCNSLHATPGVR